jgi:hypothetical protein
MSCACLRAASRRFAASSSTGEVPAGAASSMLQHS